MSHVTLWVGTSHDHYPTKVGGYKHCGIEDIFLVAEEEDFTYLLKSPLLFISKSHGLSCYLLWHVHRFDVGHTRLQCWSNIGHTQSKYSRKKTLTQLLPVRPDLLLKERKNRNNDYGKAFCVTRKRFYLKEFIDSTCIEK